MRKPILTQMWLPVSGWQYEVSSGGYIRRRRSKKLINPWWDTDGYGLVTLKKGKQQQEFYLDSLVCGAFTGQTLNGERPLHLDGSPWNNKIHNLQWGMDNDLSNRSNLVTNWTVRHKGKLSGGPFNDHGAAHSAAQWLGDTVIGRNPDRKIVAYEVKYTLDKPPGNPFDLVNYYRAQAGMHSNQFWSHMVAEAAELIESLANENLNYITEGNPALLSTNGKEIDCAPISPRRSLDVFMGRKRIAEPKPEPAEEWPLIVKRPQEPGLFDQATVAGNTAVMRRRLPSVPSQPTGNPTSNGTRRRLPPT